MSLSQRFAGVLMRQAREWVKRDMPVQAACAVKAAEHIETITAERDAAIAERDALVLNLCYALCGPVQPIAKAKSK